MVTGPAGLRYNFQGMQQCALSNGLDLSGKEYMEKEIKKKRTCHVSL